MKNKIIKCAQDLKKRLPIEPKVALVLGTGLNSLAELMENPTIIPYGEIEGFAVSTAPSHAGQLVCGKMQGVDCIIMQGRLHYYEGWSMQEITFPIRVLAALGCTSIILTNAAGSLREHLPPGTIVALRDHINFMGTNPLIGPNDESLGERFPSLNEPYKKSSIKKAHELAKEIGFELAEGVYCAVTGPNLESVAECKMFQMLGADLVGMSTVPEALVAIHNGLSVTAFSVVTNYSNLFHSAAHSQEEIRANAKTAKDNLEKLILGIVPSLI